MFEVFENDKPAILKGSDFWKKYQFNTFEEAIAYAKLWLGIYSNPNHKWELDIPYEFYTDCFLVIRENKND